MTSAQTTTIATKVPIALAARFAEHVQAQRTTTSLLLRRLIEESVASSVDGAPGPIEKVTRARLAEIVEPDSLNPSAAVAIELARRLDVDPSNGAQHSRELSRLIEDISGDHREATRSMNAVDVLGARRVLRLAGYGLTSPDGVLMCTPDPVKGQPLKDAAAAASLRYLQATGAGA